KGKGKGKGKGKNKRQNKNKKENTRKSMLVQDYHLSFILLSCGFEMLAKTMFDGDVMEVTNCRLRLREYT
ncbi:hypothetical protein PP707_04785, partial [Acetobacter pasteurianus]|nr:hypothetical protein [Acetobacter pasteurianus]